MTTPQLPLSLRLAEHTDFASFWPGSNAPLVNRLQQMAAGQADAVIYLWSASGYGRTHLLQATVRAAVAQGRPAVYLPLQDLQTFGPAVLDGHATNGLIALDDVSVIAGMPDWQHALFALCNQINADGGNLVCAALDTPNSVGITLPDLVTRLSAGPVFRLQALSDDDKLALLRLRAERRGMELPEEVARYLLTRTERALTELLLLLDQLDVASLAAQRRLTIPFVKEALVAI